MGFRSNQCACTDCYSFYLNCWNVWILALLVLLPFVLTIIQNEVKYNSSFLLTPPIKFLFKVFPFFDQYVYVYGFFSFLFFFHTNAHFSKEKTNCIISKLFLFYYLKWHENWAHFIPWLILFSDFDFNCTCITMCFNKKTEKEMLMNKWCYWNKDFRNHFWHNIIMLICVFVFLMFEVFV